MTLIAALPACYDDVMRKLTASHLNRPSTNGFPPSVLDRDRFEPISAIAPDEQMRPLLKRFVRNNHTAEVRRQAIVRHRLRVHHAACLCLRSK